MIAVFIVVCIFGRNMVSGQILIFGFFGFILLLALAMSLHARSIDPPLENEEYLAEHPELRELKRQKEKEDDDGRE